MTSLIENKIDQAGAIEETEMIGKINQDLERIIRIVLKEIEATGTIEETETEEISKMIAVESNFRKTNLMTIKAITFEITIITTIITVIGIISMTGTILDLMMIESNKTKVGYGTQKVPTKTKMMIGKTIKETIIYYLKPRLKQHLRKLIIDLIC